MKNIVLAFLLLIIPVSSVSASSINYQFQGSCDGGDMVYKWSINGRSGANGVTTPPVLTSTPTASPFPNWPTPGQPGSSFIFPFTPHDILITGIELLVISGPPVSLYMAGNDYDGDPMVYMPAGGNHIINEFAPGHEFRFPGYATSNASNLAYVDLHGACAAGTTANVMYVIYYIKDPASP